MADQNGVKETVEALKGAFALAQAVKEVTADGAQLADLVALYSKYEADVEFKAKIDAAIADAQKIPDELGELSVPDVIELIKALLSLGK